MDSLIMLKECKLARCAAADELSEAGGLSAAVLDFLVNQGCKITVSASLSIQLSARLPTWLSPGYGALQHEQINATAKAVEKAAELAMEAAKAEAKAFMKELEQSELHKASGNWYETQSEGTSHESNILLQQMKQPSRR